MAKQKKDFYSIFSLVDIQIDESTIIDNNIELNRERHLINFVLEATQNFNVEKQLSKVIINVKVLDGDTKNMYAKFVVSNIFSIDNILQFIDKNKVISIPDTFVHEMNSISLANTRGIVFALLSKTELKKLLIPLVDFSKMKIETTMV